MCIRDSDYVIDLFHVFAHKSPLLFLMKCSFSAHRLANIVSIAPVSYTHLDVYKRQATEPGMQNACRPMPIAAAASAAFVQPILIAIAQPTV